MKNSNPKERIIPLPYNVSIVILDGEVYINEQAIERNGAL